MRRLLALLSVLAVAACSPPPPEPPDGDYHVYGSAEELVATSDLIVQGIVVDSRVQLAAPPGIEPTGTATAPAAPTGRDPRVVVTMVRLTVIDVFKGDVAVGDEIEVAQPGGRYRGVDFTDTATTLMRVGQPAGYVLLLRRGAHGVYYLPNPQQAMFTVSGEGDLTGIGRQTLPIATTADLRSLAASP